MTEKEITHEGIVEGTDEQGVIVRFLSSTACSECHAKGVCSVSDSPEKQIVIESPGTHYNPGEKVDIMIIVLSLTNREGLAGLTALLILVPYYLLLKAFNHRITKEFVFKLGKNV